MTTTFPPLLTLAVLLTTAALLLSACADPQTAVGSGAPDPSDGLPTGPIPVEPDGGIGDSPGTEGDQPLPVEPDGGIGDSTSPGTEGDQPIPVEPDGGIGDGNGPPGASSTPPDFGVSSEVDSMSVPPVSYCWSGDGVGLCADGMMDPTANPITGADQLVVTYEVGTLSVTAAPAEEYDESANDTAGTNLPVVVENPGIYLVDISALDEGDHVVTLFWQGPQGDSFTSVALTVERG